jgi:hypothetical protein
MKFSTVRTYSLALPEATETPHFKYQSFRVRDKIFVTVPPGEETIHIFLPEAQREQALALHPQFVEKLVWGKSVTGVRVTLGRAEPAVVKALILAAWQHKAPKALLDAHCR